MRKTENELHVNSTSNTFQRNMKIFDCVGLPKNYQLSRSKIFFVLHDKKNVSGS